MYQSEFDIHIRIYNVDMTWGKHRHYFNHYNDVKKINIKRVFKSLMHNFNKISLEQFIPSSETDFNEV